MLCDPYTPTLTVHLNGLDMVQLEYIIVNRVQGLRLIYVIVIISFSWTAPAGWWEYIMWLEDIIEVCLAAETPYNLPCGKVNVLSMGYVR